MNPQVAELMKEIPSGYCGMCDICEQPGHTRAHPSLPTTGAWCDQHWAELADRGTFGPHHFFALAGIILAIVTIASAIWPFLH